MNPNYWRDAEMFRIRMAERFGSRWKIKRLCQTTNGQSPFDPIIEGDSSEGGTSVKDRLLESETCDRPSIGVRQTVPVYRRLRRPGQQKGNLIRINGGIPTYRPVGAEDVGPGVLAAGQPHDPEFAEGVVLINVEHPVLRSVIEHWQSRFALHHAEAIEKDIVSIYGQVAVSKVAHSEHLKGIIPAQIVEAEPVLKPTDPEYEPKLRRIQRLLKTLPENEVAVFQDEVDVHLNPKTDSMWMRKGQQAEVTTPGNNRKCHVSGSLVWKTRTLLVSQPEAKRNADLFMNHLDDLRRRLRCWKRIHVILDNARFHDCRKVWKYLARWSHRIQLHFLPKYAPEANPIERVWWHLHETITRNHRCEALTELVQQAFAWFRNHLPRYATLLHQSRMTLRFRGGVI